MILNSEECSKDSPNFPKYLDITPSDLCYPNNKGNQSWIAHVNTSVFGPSAQRDAIQKYGIAGRVWEAAYILDLYVHPQLDWEFEPPLALTCNSSKGRCFTVIELGAGIGMLSSSIAKVLKPKDLFIITDLPEVCPLLDDNLKPRNLLSDESRHVLDATAIVRPLAWGNAQHCAGIASEFFSAANSGSPRTLTHIICSDLVYFPELLAPLLRTLIHLTSPPFTSDNPHDDVTVVISYKIRSLSKETPFWSAFGLWFDFKPVLVKDKGHGNAWRRFGLLEDDTIFLFTAHRRPESLTWSIPMNDHDLIGGVGAWGNNFKKLDDTFETLLLMALEDSPEP